LTKIGGHVGIWLGNNQENSNYQYTHSPRQKYCKKF